MNLGNSVHFAPLERFTELEANWTSDLDLFLGDICHSHMLPSSVQYMIRRIHTIDRKRTNCIWICSLLNLTVHFFCLCRAASKLCFANTVFYLILRFVLIHPLPDFWISHLRAGMILCIFRKQLDQNSCCLWSHSKSPSFLEDNKGTLQGPPQGNVFHITTQMACLHHSPFS